MALNINSSFGVVSIKASTAMKASQGAMGKALSRIATGSKLASHDDPIALMKSAKIKADADGYEALSSGIQASSAEFSVANAAMDSLLDILSAMKSKAVAYAATDDSAAKTALNSDFASLQVALNAANATKYNGNSVLNDSAKFIFDIDGTKSVSVTFGATAGTVSITNVSDIETQISAVATASANMNAAASALDQISSYLQNVASAQEAAYSAITDTDMAADMTKYVKNNVIMQAAQAMVSQANQSMASVLNLLQ